jgi:hypothetical protein
MVIQSMAAVRSWGSPSGSPGEENNCRRVAVTPRRAL